MKRVMEQAVNDAIVIRQETPNDFKRVCEVVKSAFNDMADSDHSEHFLVDRLRKSDAYIPCLSLVATTIAGKIVGHILLSKAEVVAKGKRFAVLAVAPLSVLPEFQRKGIGGMLVREAHRRAAEMGYAAAVVAQCAIQKLSICSAMTWKQKIRIIPIGNFAIKSNWKT